MIFLFTISDVNGENNAMTGTASMKTVPVSHGLKLFQFNTNMFSMDGSIAKGGHSNSKDFKSVKSKESNPMTNKKGNTCKGKLNQYGFESNYHLQMINNLSKNCQKFNGECVSYIKDMQRSTNNYRRLDLTMDFMFNHKRVVAIGAFGLLNLYIRSFPQPEK